MADEQGYLVPRATLKRIQEISDWVRNFRISGPYVEARNTPAGMSVYVGAPKRPPLNYPPKMPFLARITTTGPAGEADFAKDVAKYWARKVRIKQVDPIGTPETSADAISDYEDVGGADTTFVLNNLAELAFGSNVRTYQPAPLKMLGNGHICRVWTETDDQGVARYVCSESPTTVPVWVRITGVASGAFAGIIGCYNANLFLPSHLTTPPANAFAPKATGTAYAFGAMGADFGSVLVVNLRECGMATTDAQLPAETYILGHSWGWTTETPSRRVVVVSDTASRQVTMTATGSAGASYGATEQTLINNLKADVAELIDALRDGKIMR